MGTGNMLLESVLNAIDKVDGLEDTPASLHLKQRAYLTKKKEYNECKRNAFSVVKFWQSSFGKNPSWTFKTNQNYGSWREILGQEQ